MLNARAAVVLDAGADPQLTDVQIRQPRGDEVLVRIDAVGICHTDVSVAARFRKLPMVFGHEGAGTVIETGPDAVPMVGDQVVLTFASCGTCSNCQADTPAYCERSTDLNMRGSRGESSALHADGVPIGGGFFGQSSFCTHAIAGSRNAVILPDPIDPALAAPLGCSVQTGVGAVLNVLAPQPADALVVFGAGAVGLSAVMGARIAGCRAVIAVDPIVERRALATELGATATVDPTAADVAAAVLELTGGVAAAVDTTARPDVLMTAVGVLRERGTLALLGLGALTAELPVAAIMGKGLTVRGVVEGDSEPHTFIPRLAGLHRRGELPLDKLVSRYPFDEFGRAWAAAKSADVVKPVLITGAVGS
ncbi:NAD(P)-dependent alcohol dehydrogenase [Mycolicibacterium fortuitum]|uniref:NAD(P)-dependent alcohol dehydrogenase n=1 Tax=Mycolicibacterium fortuitum TaxID=1766 RepID=UPI0007EBF7DC|nr:NAD(P)-dependent alcohol dehydrogenase [Mycolicibacterium fortuitum]MCA4722330.1 NAD(P)-dependent alcohol dehydrogenase [Mycolicibacterium fortuitum]MCA4755145.1 NAD(P)-dependent alcohol dehydrogenase [Mycolicibacterium fortuitum]OBB41061.1 aryl-alcohol dehydrogenase [Mycolicibacterium fortuitum]OBB72426.1 aryl-alcohol dehydrogenase [Mycolicibacterium fortuitum]OBF74083.1 aryl-alcohol dehydrogenase [Mycolicibacterium fortuitum]